jgi:hypothetical protein
MWLHDVAMKIFPTACDEKELGHKILKIFSHDNKTWLKVAEQRLYSLKLESSGTFKNVKLPRNVLYLTLINIQIEIIVCYEIFRSTPI